MRLVRRVEGVTVESIGLSNLYIETDPPTEPQISVKDFILITGWSLEILEQELGINLAAKLKEKHGI